MHVISEDEYIKANFSGPEHFGISVKRMKQNYRSFLLGKLEIYENEIVSKRNNFDLRSRLITNLKKLHPIHEQLNSFSKATIKFLVSKFVPNVSEKIYSRKSLHITKLLILLT